MTLTKANIIDAIAEFNGFPRNKASETVKSLLEIIKSTLASGEDVWHTFHSLLLSNSSFHIGIKYMSN